MSRVPCFARHARKANAIPPVPHLSCGAQLLHRVYVHKSTSDVEFEGDCCNLIVMTSLKAAFDFRARGNDVIAVSRHTKRIEKEGMASFARIAPVVAQLYALAVITPLRSVCILTRTSPFSSLTFASTVVAVAKDLTLADRWKAPIDPIAICFGDATPRS